MQQNREIERNQNYQMRTRNHSLNNNGSIVSQSSVSGKLRTIMKHRSSHNAGSQRSEEPNYKYRGRLPTLPDLPTHNHATISHSALLERHEESQRSETINCEEDLILDKDWKCSTLKNRMRELDRKAEELIHKKLLKISRKSKSISLKDKGRDELSEELEELIKSVRKIKLEAIEDGLEQGQIKKLMDEKINLLEKLLAEQTTEAAILKKYFFAVSAINQRKKFATGGALLKTINPSRLTDIPISSKKHLSTETANHLSFQAPKPDQYETYRHKNIEYSANPQPLPRSSYNRQFLTYDSLNQGGAYKNLEANPFFGLQAKQMGSKYNRDYKGMQAERVNYKELDSYRNKIKDIQIFYAYNKKEMSEEELALNKQYVRDQMKNNLRASTPIKKIPSRTKVVQPVKAPLLSTESRSAYLGTQGSSCDIKNKGLERLKYAYKSITHC